MRAGCSLMGRVDGLGCWSEELQLDSNARHQGDQDAGGDDADCRLHGSAPGQPESGQQRAQVADIFCGILALKPDFLQGAASAGFGSANQERFKCVSACNWCPPDPVIGV